MSEERVFRHDVAAGVTGQVGGHMTRLDGYGNVVEEFEREDAAKGSVDTFEAMAALPAEQRYGNVGASERADAAPVDEGSRQDEKNDAVAKAQADMVERRKNAWRTGRKHDGKSPPGATKSARAVSLQNGATTAAGDAQAGDDVDEGNVGGSDGVAEAQQRMVTKRANAWRTRKRAGRR